MNQPAPLDVIAQDVADALRRTNTQLVLAESCTAGLVAAALGGVPGISQHFCGSAVVYQEPTKTAWLEVPAESLAEFGAVSAEIATAMASGALATTPHADFALAITGHLGPDAPPELDGVVYLASQYRDEQAAVERHHLRPVESHLEKTAGRKARQEAAARLMLERVLKAAAEKLRGGA